MASEEISVLSDVNSHEGLLCPSAVGHVGALAIAKRDANDLTTLLAEPFPITKEFVDEQIALQGAPLETAYRFASECIQRKCRNWRDGKCGVATGLTLVDPAPEKLVIPPCSIRERCRWFHQEGYNACYACTHFPTRIERQSAVRREQEAI